MSFKFSCPHCGQRIGAADEDIGTIGGCPACGEQFKVPEPPPPGPTFLTPPPQRAHAQTAAPWVNPPRLENDELKPRRGLSILALVFSIFPGLNIVGLLLGIVAVVRSDRDGHHGERGLAICALVACGVLLVPVNIGGYLAAGPVLHIRMPGMVEFKPVHDIPDFVVDEPLTKPPTPKSQPTATVAPQGTSKIVESKQPAKGGPDINPSADLLGVGGAQKAGTPVTIAATPPPAPAQETAPK
ncbi:MAG TPA: DUF4190 domain-containing protein [Chthoniobacter sp.]|nr:DUF4190 domain-containing protein [Chthoniobacter sp.]